MRVEDVLTGDLIMSYITSDELSEATLITQVENEEETTWMTLTYLEVYLGDLDCHRVRSGYHLRIEDIWYDVAHVLRDGKIIWVRENQ